MSGHIKPGTRVHVWDMDLNDLGPATYEGNVGFDDDGNEIPLAEGEWRGVAKAILEITGRVVYADFHWFFPTNEEREIQIAMEQKAKTTILN